MRAMKLAVLGKVRFVWTATCAVAVFVGSLPAVLAQTISIDDFTANRGTSSITCSLDGGYRCSSLW